MARAEHWSQLRAGLLALAVVVAIAAAVLVFGRIGALHGDTTRLYMVTDKATGVLNGTEVWLAGQKVGLVRSVALRPPSSDTTERVAITMDVLNQYMQYIRRNSDVEIRPGGRLMGSPVVYITVGTTRSPAAASGDTLRARAQIEARSALSDASSLGDSLTEILATVSTIRTSFDTTLQDVAELRRRSERQAQAVHAALDRFSVRALASRGTISDLAHDSASLRAQTTHLRAVADSIGAAASGNGDIGRFRRDSTLILAARRTLASVTELRQRVLRYAGDSVEGATLAKQLDRTHAQLDSLVQDAKRHPLRYIAF